MGFVFRLIFDFRTNTCLFLNKLGLRLGVRVTRSPSMVLVPQSNHNHPLSMVGMRFTRFVFRTSCLVPLTHTSHVLSCCPYFLQRSSMRVPSWHSSHLLSYPATHAYLVVRRLHVILRVCLMFSYELKYELRENAVLINLLSLLSCIYRVVCSD